MCFQKWLLLFNTVKVENVSSRTAADGPKSSTNIADEMQTLLSRLSAKNEDFVRSVCILLHQEPIIILYTADQIDDLRLLCSRDCTPSLRTVLGVDRTFNLSSLFVTMMVYKNKKFVRKATQETPIFIGPIMLHKDGKFGTYLHFFTTVNAALNGSVVHANEFMYDGLVVGSDEESALVNAAKVAFPSSNNLYCMLHAKDNVRHHLTTIGVPSAVSESVLARLFGSSGISESPDEYAMDNRIADLLQFVRLHNIDVVSYLQDRVLPKIANNNRLRWREQWIGQHQWTNNNCESANSLLKLQVRYD